MARWPEPIRSLTGSRAALRARALLGRYALPLLLLLALALRINGIGWDGGHLFHPDERAILLCVNDLGRSPDYYDSQRMCGNAEAPWNPGWFPYGSLPIYLLKSVQVVLSPIVHLDLAGLALAGRAISALADVGTVLLLYLLARGLYGRGVGLLAAALASVAVIHIQLAHFYAVDTLLTLLVTGALLADVRVVRGGGAGASAAAGVLAGLALATKVSAAPLLLPLALAHLLAAIPEGGDSPAGAADVGARLRRATGGLAVAGAALAVAAFVAQPYALLDSERFLGDVIEQSEMVRRVRDYPYTRQYVDTAPYFYQVWQHAVFGLGAPLGLAAWGGLALAVASAALPGRGLQGPGPGGARWLPLAWALPTLLVTGAFEVKFLRYLLPVTPLLLMYASRALLLGRDLARKRGPRLSALALAALGLVVASTALYALAYQSIYASPHPAVRAARWFNATAAPGSAVLKEHWEEGLPDMGRFRVSELPMYEPDTPQKTRSLAKALADSDYLVFYSSRLYGTIPRLPDHYPDSSRYYALLFQGGLGYELARFEESYPSLPGIALVNDTFARPGLPAPEPLASHRPAPLAIPLGFADESFAVYDHPLVMVFRNAGRLSEEEMYRRLSAAPPQAAALPGLMPPERAAAQQRGGTWRDIAPLNGLGARFPLPMWLLAVYAGSLAVTPVALVVFQRLPDRGYLLARPLALLGLSYVPWLLASLEWVPFGRGGIAAGLLAAGSVSAWAGFKWRADLGAFVRGHWRLLLLEEAVFLAALLSFTVVRMANPDLWHPFRGGEKPMDLAYLNAVVRSTYMPPYDPWLAGGSINYYYFGQTMVAVLVRATGVPTNVAYNLAVPLLFALTSGAAFSLGYNIAEGARRALRGRPRRAPGWSPVAAGAAALLLVVVMGNLDGGVQLLQAAREWVSTGTPFPPFDYWRPTRMMPPDPPGFEITEFPFFTYLFGDLHAHMAAMPVALLVVGLSLNAMLLRGRGAGGGVLYATLGLLALAVGGLWATNAWDFPTYLALAVASICVGECLAPPESGGGWRRAVRAGTFVATVAALAVALWIPYWQGVESAYGGVAPSPARTAPHQYLAVHGVFVYVLGTSLALALWPLARRWFRGASGVRAWGTVAVALTAEAALLSLAGWGYGTAAMLIAAGLAAAAAGCWVLARGRLGPTVAPAPPERPFLVMPVLLLGLALGLGLAVEVVAVRGDIERMNTVFKLYLQAWLLLALASSFALWHTLFAGGMARTPRPWRALWLGGLALLLASASVYPVLGTRARLADRFHTTPLTLDGTAYMTTTLYTDDRGTVELRWDLEAMQWLLESVEGSPVVMEGRTPLYRWGGRVSVYTGLPSVVGWDWHQKQQRCGLAPCPEVEARLRDVDRFYSTRDPAEALALLERYGVGYVYAGQTERLYYPPEGLAKLGDMAAAGDLEEVYSNPGTVVYRVAGEGP